MNFEFSGMILAAGFGKRMMPLTKNLPKPLININGVTLLDNSINFLKRLGCKQIIINTHYKHSLINESIKKREDNKMIKLVYEQEILDTGGGVKNIIPYVNNENLIIINSDVFWQKENDYDAQLLIKNFLQKKLLSLLLVNKKKTFGLNRNTGDFYLKNNKIFRYKKGNPVYFYSGFQILPISIFDFFPNKIFSFNDIWNYLIDEKKICGAMMNYCWYHVGDIQGLTIAKKLVP